MGYYFNKIAWSICNPATLGLILFGVTSAYRVVHREKRRPIVLSTIAFVWLWIWATPLMTFIIGCPLESEYLSITDDGLARMRLAEEYPESAAIILLCGGVGATNAISIYPQLSEGADRAYFAAKLYHAGRSPAIVVSGKEGRNADLILLNALGVPKSAVFLEETSRTTEENAKMVSALEIIKRASGEDKPILLVTDAWHMKRAMQMFKLYAPNLNVIPAVSDFETVGLLYADFEMRWLLPDCACVKANAIYLHEWLGIFRYMIFR